MSKRIHIIVPDDVHKGLKVKAASEELTMTEAIIKLIREWIMEDYKKE